MVPPVSSKREGDHQGDPKAKDIEEEEEDRKEDRKKKDLGHEADKEDDYLHYWFAFIRTTETILNKIR